jgi:hypothetical protein
MVNILKLKSSSYLRFKITIDMILDTQTEEQSTPAPQPQTGLRITPQIRGIWSEIITWTIVSLGTTLVYFVIASINAVVTSNRMKALNPELGNYTQSQQIVSLFFIAIFVVWPGYYLFQFVTKLKKGLDNDESDSITESFRYLRYNYAFYGIITAIYFGLIAIFLLIGILFAGLSR